jgi:predicted SAM-dependent methyltransferase
VNLALGRAYERAWLALQPDRVRAVVNRFRPSRRGPSEPRDELYAFLDDQWFVEGAYRYLLQRAPDPTGLQTYLGHLRAGTRTRETMLAEMRGLDEFWSKFAFRYYDPLLVLHRSRCLFVQGFPRADRILDLGGTHQQAREGALVLLGYPYPFERLCVVDLPVGDRHELYRQIGEVDREETELGTVEYHYRSMVDLSIFPDGEFGLVYSGQSIEHVTGEEADQVLAEAFRVLRPGGHLCLDTPNFAASRLQLEGTDMEFTNPDHKIEYTHAELSRKLEASGFSIVAAKGLVHLPETFRTGKFSNEEMGTNTGVFDDIEQCSLLAYVCRKRG